MHSQEFPQGKPHRTFHCKLLCPCISSAPFLLPTPHYGKKPPRGAYKSISRFGAHLQPSPLQEKTPVPTGACSTDAHKHKQLLVCSPLLLLILIKKKNLKKSHSQPSGFQIWEVQNFEMGKCGKGGLQICVVTFQVWRMKGFESSFCSRMDTLQVVQSFHV